MHTHSTVARCILVCLLSVAACIGAEERVIEPFDGERVPAHVKLSNIKAKPIRYGDGRALELKCVKGDSARLSLAPTDGPWDWTGTAGVAIDVHNPQRTPLEAFLRTYSRDETGKPLTARVGVPLPAGERTTAKFFFDNYGAGPYWGMRGIPVYGPLSLAGPKLSSFAVDRSRVTGFQFYLLNLEESCKLVVDNVRVFTHDSPLNALVSHPFIDRFGQYIHADWPGKVGAEADLVTQRDEEAARLRAEPTVAGRDKFGGWADGPRPEATGWFRTEKIDGKWWLVTPEGHLFFSLGVNSVGTSASTFVEGRDGWFAGLPAPEGPFKRFFGYTGGTHSMADAIGGKGRNFNFYGANLYRKYGDDWPIRWRETTCKRLAAWGFNTFGNWCAGDVRANSPLPFTATVGSGSARRIEGGGGFWGKMLDVFDPSFENMTDERVGGGVKPYADNTLCIGYFVDNELSWDGIASGALNSPVDQPCRQAFVTDLKRKYETIDGLNAAWRTNAKDWESLRAPRAASAACNEDSAAFEYKFARRYFDTIAAALGKHAPNQLYLGCRFAVGLRKPHIMKACAEVVDVVSINQYTKDVKSKAWTGEHDLGKPIIVGEFHFGALDAGMFHQGLAAARDQADRGACYARYVRSLAECPAFVGCHWFEYVDEATTGRTLDGENFNIGLVNVADRPYYAMVKTMTQINEAVYAIRAGK